MSTYTYSALDDPLGNSYTTATGINNAGQIVGWYLVQPGQVHHGFLYSGGTYITLDDPLAGNPFTISGTLANGINATGQVVGFYGTDSGVIHGFLYSGGSGGTYTTIDDPLAVNTYAYAINVTDQIVGSYQDTANGYYHGFLFSGGTYVTLNDPLTTNVATDGTWATGINDQGHIVGYYTAGASRTAHGFFYSGGTYTTIDDPLGINGTWVTGVNDQDHIVGYYRDNNGDHGFVYDGNSYTTVDVPPSPSGTQASGINHQDQIVGAYFDSIGAHGFLATVSPLQPNVTLTDRNLVVEMAHLANEAYDESPRAAMDRNWHAVSAAELNLHDNGISGGVSYTFSNGLYEAAIPAVPGAHASALVREGMVDGEKTLTLAFRGTDDFGDVINWPTAHAYFADFAPLILSLHNYIAANGIEQVLATGHSLGGSMVQDLLAINIGIGPDRESGYTWGSPGSDLHPTNAHLVNFVHPTDPVSNFGGLVGDVRVGTDVVLHSPFVSNSLFDKIGGLAHRMDIYFADTLDLADLARSSDIFGSRPEGVAVQTGNFWTGNVNSFQVLPGTDHNDDVHISSSDKFVLGAKGDDTFRWDIRNFNAPPVIIDGGPGIDTLFLPGSSNSWDLVTNGAETNLYFKSAHSLVAELFGIESVHFQNGVIAQIRQPLLAGNDSVNNPVHDSPSIAGLHGLSHNDGWLFS